MLAYNHQSIDLQMSSLDKKKKKTHICVGMMPWHAQGIQCYSVFAGTDMEISRGWRDHGRLNENGHGW